MDCSSPPNASKSAFAGTTTIFKQTFMNDLIFHMQAAMLYRHAANHDAAELNGVSRSGGEPITCSNPTTLCITSKSYALSSAFLSGLYCSCGSGLEKDI